MLTTAATLALCVQVADLSSLYLSFHPDGQQLEEQMDEAEIRWAERLRAEAGSDEAFVVHMHDGFVHAMRLDGAGFWQQWEGCVAQFDAPRAPGQKG